MRAQQADIHQSLGIKNSGRILSTTFRPQHAGEEHSLHGHQPKQNKRRNDRAEYVTSQIRTDGIAQPTTPRARIARGVSRLGGVRRLCNNT
jgi:hypothetical protein